MPALKIALMSLILLSSTSVLAEGGSDRLIQRSEALAQQRQEQTMQLATDKDRQPTAERHDSHGMNTIKDAPAKSKVSQR